jgi:uncharacterized Zn finger protein
MAGLECQDCGFAYIPAEFLDCVEHYESRIDVVMWRCRQCLQVTDIRIRSGEVQRGNVYAAGSAHFSVEERIEVPGLRRMEEGDGLRLAIQQRQWVVRPRPRI